MRAASHTLLPFSTNSVKIMEVGRKVRGRRRGGQIRPDGRLMLKSTECPRELYDGTLDGHEDNGGIRR